jgi:hypothetical protein
MYQYFTEHYLQLTIILVILLLVYICYNLYKKVKIYESWVDNIDVRIKKLKSDINEVDERKLFEKDDDVGFVYENISELIKDFDTMTNNT